MLIALLVVGIGLLIWLIVVYNGLVSLKQMTQNAWSDVDVYLKRRAELIPNLVAAVQAYASHEQATLENLVNARNRAMALHAPTPEKASNETTVQSGVSHALFLAEAYPDLRSSENFQKLQDDLRDTEKLIANARQYYNACVRDYNTKIESFPGNVVSGMARANPAEFFQLDSLEEAQVPKV